MHHEPWFANVWHRARLRLLRSIYRRKVEAVFREMSNTIDWARFEDRFARYRNASGTVTYAKYLDMDYWLREALSRFFVYGFQRLGRPSRFLDLGCGGGQFLLVCRHFGHQAVGLDLDTVPLFNDMVEYFAIPRVVHRIGPFLPLPSLPHAPFDVVTAFMTCFNRYSDGRPWQDGEWVEFLCDLRRQLSPTGQVVIKFNWNQKTHELYPKQVRDAIDALDGFRAWFFHDSLRLTASASAK